jgi:ABC-type nitrate/sulfonate/bicarbonate transport system ATPase subunit
MDPPTTALPSSRRTSPFGYESHRERQRLTALTGFSLSIDKGEFVVLVGPSGCGKTTYINAHLGSDQTLGGLDQRQR